MDNKFILDVKVKSIDESNFIVDALVTNNSLDAQGEIVLNSAWKDGFKRYKSNPVLMTSHNIEKLGNVIGECVNIKKDSDGVSCKFKYFVGEGNSEADWGFTLAKKGIAAYSVGFMAHGCEYDEEKIKELLKQEKINIKKSGKVYAVITDAELYEVSQVAVPANKDALMKSKSFINKSKEEIEDIYNSIIKEIEDIYKAKGIITYTSYPAADNGDKWDATKEVDAVRVWAGYDGEKVESTDFKKYEKAFGYVDSENSKTFEAYKFPHHSVENDKLKTHWKGLTSAMQRLQSSDLTEDEKEKLYTHLAKHYKNDFDKEPPEYKKEEKEKGIMANIEINLEDLIRQVTKGVVEETIRSLESKVDVISSKVFKALDDNNEIYDQIAGKIKSLEVKTDIDELKQSIKSICDIIEIEKEGKKEHKEKENIYKDILKTLDNFNI
jgi:hypothetical protein